MKNIELADQSQEQTLRNARTAPLSLADCYAELDVNPNTNFSLVQKQYRSLLHQFNLFEVEPRTYAHELRSNMLNKLRVAYVRICKHLKQNPEHGLEETGSSLIAERDSAVAACRNYSCGTTALGISEEYEDRVRILKARLAQ